jgi:hypothetical protein
MLMVLYRSAYCYTAPCKIHKIDILSVCNQMNLAVVATSYAMVTCTEGSSFYPDLELEGPRCLRCPDPCTEARHKHVITIPDKVFKREKKKRNQPKKV